MRRELLLGVLLTILATNVLTLTLNIQTAEAIGAIYIRVDGSVDPPTAPIQRDGDLYTFTSDINDSIVVERDDVVVDGASHSLQGTGSPDSNGIDLSGRSNVTVKSVGIKAFEYGIRLSGSFDNSVSGNNITNNEYGGIHLYSSSNNSISGNNITNSGWGIYLYSSSNNSINGNNITNSSFDGIELWSSNCNGLSENHITNSNHGIFLCFSSNYNSLSGNYLTANSYYGTALSSSSNNSISENNITNNRDGIYLETCSNNSISGNNIAENENGIVLSSSSNCNICHNNFVDNIMHASASSGYANAWDSGYPSGGNHWSGYGPEDADCDGIGDAEYSIGANNTDHYPLMGMFYSFNVTYFTPPIETHFCDVTVISNSTISDFVAPVWIEHPEVIFLMFNVSGAEGSTGFCRVSFPTAMMNGTHHVSINGTEIPFTLLLCSDANMSYLYFSYTHSTETVIIVPEFHSSLILPLFMLATLLAAMVYRRKRLSKNAWLA